MQLALLMILPTRMPTVMMLSVTQAPLSSHHTQSLTTANDNTDSDLLGSGPRWIMINALEQKPSHLPIPVLTWSFWLFPSRCCTLLGRILSNELRHSGITSHLSSAYATSVGLQTSPYPIHLYSQRHLPVISNPYLLWSSKIWPISSEKAHFYREEQQDCCASLLRQTIHGLYPLLRTLGPSEARISVGLPKISQVMGMAELAWHWVPALQSTTSASMRPLDSWHAAPCAPSSNREHRQQYRSMAMSSVGTHTHTHT